LLLSACLGIEFACSIFFLLFLLFRESRIND
jgi:hypothetical protein